MKVKNIYDFFDKLEDRVRGLLSHCPILYALLAGAGVVIFWRGVWHSYDYAMERYFTEGEVASTVNYGGLPWWDGPVSLAIGSIILLLTGVFVSSFIGNEIIITGLRGEKKTVEKTEEELEEESSAISAIKRDVRDLKRQLAAGEKPRRAVRNKAR